MELEQLRRYTDATACLHQTLREGRKSSNVDILLMLSNVQRCEKVVQELITAEEDTLLSTALSGLTGSLSVHAGILKHKIEQLNNGRLAAPHHTPPTQRLPTPPAQGGNQPQAISTPKPNAPRTTTLRSNERECTTAEVDDDSDTKLCTSRAKMIQSTIVRSELAGFSDVIGLVEAKQSLHDAIIMPLDYPHLFSGGRKPWKRVLLYGPPGTGKTRLAQALSAEVRATFYSVSSADLVSSFIGESEKLVKELFHHARDQTGQAIIFIDEIDSLCRRRSTREDDSTRRIKTELLIQMEAVDRSGGESGQVFLLCATNCPWDLDNAFLRRFQKRIYIPLPESRCRIEMLKFHCRDSRVDMSECEWEHLAEVTQGYSGSDLATLTNGALLQPVRELRHAVHLTILSDTLRC